MSLDFDIPFDFLPKYPDDDLSDRLHHRWTVILLLFFIFIAGFEVFVGYPLRCWCPAQFTDSHCNYTEAYCWMEDNYYVPPDDYIPNDVDDRDEIEIKYYQWVPIILLFLALSYKMPNLIWTMFNTRCGMNIEKIIELCTESRIGDERDANMQRLSTYFDRWLETQKKATSGLMYKILERISTCFCFCIGKKTGTYLTGLYLDIKLCYIAVSLGLLFLLNKLLAMDYTLYGAEVISNLASNTMIKESPRFPRQVLCDFEIRQLQNMHRYTVQCVLSINLFYEKIFTFLWFWFFLMICFSTYSYIKWVINTIVPSFRVQFVRKYVVFIEKQKRRENSPEDNPMEHNDLVKFARDYLGTDLVFVLRMIEYNTNEMVICDLMRCLLEKWNKHQ